mgnify:CR=1 FL=1
MINYTILQIDPTADNCHYLFTGTKEIKKLGLPFPPPESIYREVYSSSQEKYDPEEIYKKFNLYPPEDYTGRSLSVSDIIRYKTKNGDTLNLYCDSFGFYLLDFSAAKDSVTEIKIRLSSKKKGLSFVFLYENSTEQRQKVIPVGNLVSGKTDATDFREEPVKLSATETFMAFSLLFEIFKQSHPLKGKSLNSVLQKYLF